MWMTFWQEFAFVVFAFSDFLRRILFNATVVVSHHITAPSVLLNLFHRLQVLMEALTLFITCSKVHLEMKKVILQKIDFNTHVVPKISNSQQCFFRLQPPSCLAFTYVVIGLFDLTKSWKPKKYTMVFSCSPISKHFLIIRAQHVEPISCLGHQSKFKIGFKDTPHTRCYIVSLTSV